MHLARNLTFQRVVITFVLALVSQLLNGHHGDMYHDAWGYLNLATKMVSHDGRFTFSLLNFDSSLRGYLFSLVLLPLLAVQSITHLPLTLLTKVFGSLWAAGLLGWLLPKLWQRLAGPAQRISWSGFLLFVGAFLLFWRDNLTFTLTDVPSLTLLLGGIFCLERKKSGWWLLAGLCIAAATNFRPVYSITLPIIGGFMVWLLWRPGPWPRWLGLVGFVLGMGIVGLPQAYINYHRFGKTTPFVLGIRKADDTKANVTKADVAKANALDNLYLWHLNAGIVTQKFGPAMVGAQPNTVQFAIDTAGVVLIAERKGQPFRSVGEYAGYVLQHPSEFLAIYTRHLFNLLDVDYPTTYILEIHPPPAWYCWINYSLLFLGGVAFLYLPRPRSVLAIVTLLALGAVVAASIPIMPESRLALPLHLLLLAAATLGFEPRVVWHRWRQDARLYRRTVVLAVCYFGWISVAFALHTSCEAVTTWPLPKAVVERLL